MIKFHAVLLDETGREFGVDIEATDKAAAYAELMDRYPESRVIQVESPEESRQREQLIYQRMQEELDYY